MNSVFKTLLIVALAFVMVSCNQQNRESDTSSPDNEPDTVRNVKRYGWVIQIKPEKLDLYKELHANPWPGVLEQITKSNIRNYSIYLKDNYLFGYYEYVGDDFEGDMALVAKDSTTLEWWKMTDPCQVPLETRADGEWWASMEEVFHHD